MHELHDLCVDRCVRECQTIYVEGRVQCRMSFSTTLLISFWTQVLTEPRAHWFGQTMCLGSPMEPACHLSLLSTEIKDACHSTHPTSAGIQNQVFPAKWKTM